VDLPAAPAGRAGTAFGAASPRSPRSLRHRPGAARPAAGGTGGGVARRRRHDGAALPHAALGPGRRRHRRDARAGRGAAADGAPARCA
jgi:hypothetical protein